MENDDHTQAKLFIDMWYVQETRVGQVRGPSSRTPKQEW